MSATTKISFSISNSNNSVPLGAEVWLDDQKIRDHDHVLDTIVFDYDLVDDEAQHQLQIVMKNKTVEHTEIDESGNIVKDAYLIIKDMSFDEIKLEQIFTEKAVYTHDFNGSQPCTTQNKFFGTMGCNGVVSLEFSTPIYLWLLENM